VLAALAVAAAAGQVTSPPTAPADFTTLAKQFDYDATAPLDVQETSLTSRPGHTIHQITYASPVAGRVPAYLLVPERPGPHPALLFGHWGEGDHTEFLEEAGTYASRGVVCLLPAYPWVRPAPWQRALGNFAAPELDKAIYVQAVVDMRRGIDVLFARADVDRTRLAYVGHSYGAQWGAILTAVDRRMAAAVLMTGVPNLDCIFRRDTIPALAAFIKTWPPGQLDRYLAVQSALSAEHYIGHAASIPLLFQFGSDDHNFERTEMERYFSLAREPKTLRWYPAAHALADPQAPVDRFAFLSGILKISR
jgi:dienelactone hydrolase